jgi:hypothetical protein
MKKMILAPWLLLSALGLMGIVGLFGTDVGEAQAGMEVKCLAGTVPNAARTACVPCPKGTYTDFDGANECMRCPDGHICPEPGTSRPEMCKANRAARFDRTACIICSNGFYSEEASQCISPNNTIESCCLKNL